jgi:hypothetical protein
MAEKKAVANLLYSQGVAPRVYDLIKLQSENGAFHYAFVVEHIDGEVLHGSRRRALLLHVSGRRCPVIGMDTISIRRA